MTKQFWQLYAKLPQQLKNALFSEKIGDDFFEICKKNNIEESHGQIVDYIGQVLIGILPLENFQKTLEQELKIKKIVAQKVAQDVDNLIFSPVKESLAKIYGKEIPAEKEKPITPGKPVYPPGQDTYREPIE